MTQTGRAAVAVTCLALGAFIALLAPSAAAAQAEGQRFVNVVEASGLLDPVVVDFLEDAIVDSERTGAEALVIQLDSEGSVVSQEELDALLVRMHDARVPIAVWVGPSGSNATGGAALLVDAAHVAGMAPGSRVGDAPGDALFPPPAALRTGTLGPDEALEQGIVDLNEEEAAIVGTFIAALDGHEAAGRTIDTATFTDVDDGPREATLDVQTRLAKLDLLDQLMHTVASPATAYLLLAVGLGLLVFELFTAGIGIAGVVGAVCLVLSAYGLAVLPTSLVGLGLMLLGMFGFAVDLQTGVPRLWTGIGTVAFAVGSFLLFGDVPRPWIALVVGVVGMVIAMLAGMPAMIRTRFSPPTIGRESMLGELGEAVADVRPDGIVRIREALWRAHTNRATPIATGDRVRVVGIDGLLLEVEPEEGGARDYRDAARDRRGTTG